jgi:hypothetical protein
MDKAKYWALAVGGALSKLYAFLLERRLSRWGEASVSRRFRSKRGTGHNLFLFRHLADQCRVPQAAARAAEQGLYVCQVDFDQRGSSFSKLKRVEAPVQPVAPVCAQQGGRTTQAAN